MKYEELMNEFLKVKRSLWGPETYTDLVSQYNNDVYPVIGRMDINEITPPILIALLRKIEGRGNINTARRTRARIDQVYRYAIACGYTAYNPACGLVDALQPHKVKGHAFLNADTTAFKKFLRAVRDGGKLNEIHYDAWLLIVYTAKRRSEVAFAEWSEIDFAKSLWQIPAERTKTGKPHACPLSPSAIRVLQRRNEQRRNQYIFPHASL